MVVSFARVFHNIIVELRSLRLRINVVLMNVTSSPFNPGNFDPVIWNLPTLHHVLSLRRLPIYYRPFANVFVSFFLE